MGGQRLTMLALAALLLPLAAQAEEQGGGSAACRADAQKFCASASDKKECLIDHQKDLSEACYGFLKGALQRERGYQACKADAQKFCAGVKPGGGGIKECLIDHQKDISDDCYDMLKKSLKQGSAEDPAPAAVPVAAAPIVKYRDASGHLVYTNAPVANASEVRDRTNGALPLR